MKTKKKSAVSWIMEFAGQKKGHYILSVILALCGSICQMLPFFVIANIIQKLLSGNKDFNGYLIDCGIMAIIWILRVIFHSLSTSTSHVATFNVLGNIRKRGLRKLSMMPLGDVQNRGSGELKTILVERVDSIETTLAHVIPEVTGNLCVLIATVIYLFVIDWRMALISLITLPIGILCYSLMLMGYEENYGRTVRSTKALNDTAVEYINGIEVIKVFGKAKSSYEKFVADAKECAASYIDWMRKSNIYFTFALNIMPATMITVLPLGVYLMRNGNPLLSSENFIMVTILALGLISPIINIAAYGDDVAKLGTIIGEVTDIIDSDEMKRPEKDLSKPKDNTIEFKDVHFGYSKDKEVLHGINATFESGTVNALVGPSGSGKSTIAKLIASFWDVTDGSIKLGGVDVRDLSYDNYYKKIAYVSQDNFLFNKSIKENIRAGNLNASDEDIYSVTKECGCYDFIMSLENGFDTVVGSGGCHLSGGEKQRISIARAMLKNAPIIILDEATAYTDPENEALIQRSVAKLIAGKTLIVIAHRLSTIVNADQIIVVDKGKIDSSGTHEELLTKSALYSKLWNAHISSKDTAIGGNENV